MLVYIIIYILDYILYIRSRKDSKHGRKNNKYQTSIITPRHYNTQFNDNQASQIRR